MASKVIFPIRVKLLALISGLVLAATASYLILAVRVFQEDKTLLIYELNAANVKTLAAEVDSATTKLTDKISLLTQGHRDAAWTRAVLETEPDLIAYTLFTPGEDGKSWRPAASIRNAEYLKLYGLPASEIEKIREKIPVPFVQVLARKFLVLNSTLEGGAPILTIAVAAELQGDNGNRSPAVAVADLRADRFIRIFSQQGIASVYLMDSQGQLLVHPDSKLMAAHASLSDNPIVRDAVDSPLAFQEKRFHYADSDWLGAYAKNPGGNLIVVSQVVQKQAFLAAARLIEKSALFAVIVITAALLISELFARGLTEPLQQLVAATERLSRWDFSQTVSVRTRDEIASLARSFNAMAGDLQSQRTQLEQSKNELELKVQERTSALESQKRQIVESQDAMMRTTRLASLGELAGAAAHEVLNPVNNMNIRIEKIRNQYGKADAQELSLLREIVDAWSAAYRQGGWEALQAELKKASQDASKPMVQEDLENLTSVIGDFQKRMGDRSEDMEFLAKEIVRITRIINNMRSLSRVGGERRPLDIHAPIDDTAVALADALEKRKVTLVKDYGSETRDQFQVVADKDELVQVFSNLIRNAMHAVDGGDRRRPEIRVATRRNGERVEVRISDNGTGITQQNLPRIFEPTFTTKSVEEGTGLGLSISRRLVRAFGGDIDVEKTVEGEGTTFLVWFPTSTS